MRTTTPGQSLIVRVSQFLMGVRALDEVGGLDPQTAADLAAMRTEIMKMDVFELATFRRPSVHWRSSGGDTVPIALFGRETSSIRSGLIRLGVPVSEASITEFTLQAARRTVEAQRAMRNARGATSLYAPGSNDTICFAPAHFLFAPKPLGLGPSWRAALPPGRYCFGALDQDGFNFQNVVWPCPGVVMLDERR